MPDLSQAFDHTGKRQDKNRGGEEKGSLEKPYVFKLNRLISTFSALHNKKEVWYLVAKGNISTLIYPSLYYKSAPIFFF